MSSRTNILQAILNSPRTVFNMQSLAMLPEVDDSKTMAKSLYYYSNEGNNLLDESKLDLVYDKIRRILLRFGTIDDEAKKLYGPILVLNYGKDEQHINYAAQRMGKPSLSHAIPI